MATVSCPRCHQLIDNQAITCPHCRLTLKAYGHPGITLHRAPQDGYLCDSCVYHADNTCNFTQHPYAKECTLYENLEARKLEQQQQRMSNNLSVSITNWVKRHQALFLLLGLFLVCLLIVVSTS